MYKKLSIIFCFLCLLSFAEGFEIKLSLENAHIAELIFACDKDASDGYDRGKDIFCPPGAMGNVGLAWFAAPAEGLPSLYKDVRDCKFPKEWKLLLKPGDKLSIKLHWEEAEFPEGLDFHIIGDELLLDMKKTKNLELDREASLTISVKKSEKLDR